MSNSIQSKLNLAEMAQGALWSSFTGSLTKYWRTLQTPIQTLRRPENYLDHDIKAGREPRSGYC